MPKLKQPRSLKAMAMDALVEFVLQYLDQLSQGSLEKFSRGVTFVKEDLRDPLPWHLLAEFSNELVEKFFNYPCDIGDWTQLHFKAAAEIFMDAETVGLKLNSGVLNYVDLQNIHRLRGLSELNLLFYRRELAAYEILEACELKDLTTLMISSDCIDHCLTVVGRNCPKLQCLLFGQTMDFTDEGLRALNPCRELRVIDIASCEGFSHVGINHLITAHEKLEVFSYSTRYEFGRVSNGLHFLSHLNKPCLSMKRFCISTDTVTNDQLRLVVEKFPNLTHLRLGVELIGDLLVLKSPSKLEGIDIVFSDECSRFNSSRAWGSLKEVLTFIGDKITTLTFFRLNGEKIYCLEGGSLNYITESCPNIVSLKLAHVCHNVAVGPFRKLKVLDLVTDDDTSVAFQVEQLGAMLDLEILQLHSFSVPFEAMESIILDNLKLPKLARLGISYSKESEIREIERIARDQNLDFRISAHIVESD